MSTGGIKVNMTPSHPGDFIRKEVIEELSLNVTKTARILGIRRATLRELSKLLMSLTSILRTILAER